jgi:hypothetical protein
MLRERYFNYVLMSGMASKFISFWDAIDKNILIFLQKLSPYPD